MKINYVEFYEAGEFENGYWHPAYPLDEWAKAFLKNPGDKLKCFVAPGEEVEAKRFQYTMQMDTDGEIRTY